MVYRSVLVIIIDKACTIITVLIFNSIFIESVCTFPLYTNFNCYNILILAFLFLSDQLHQIFKEKTSGL